MRFSIKRTVDGSEQVICECAPTYHATYLQVPYLEVQSLAFDSFVKIKIGDYIDWRDGIRYKVYRLPNLTQNTAGYSGNQFEYDVIFYHPCKQLEIALWKDLVYDDNGIHYSSQKSISTYEALDGIARRIQSCLDYQYPSQWNVTIADGLADVAADITEPMDYSLEAGQTVLDALNLIYDTWDNVGWTYKLVNGVNTIVIGGANVKTSDNTIPNYAIGKGKGITRIKATLSNSGDICTRLYPFGSSRNLPARYYNSKNILNAESVDIQNLMIPTDYWGKTDALPDASKAYIDNTDAIDQFGIIPKVIYLNGDEYGDVYPTIEGLTIGDVRNFNKLSGKYYPSPNIYTDAKERVDLVLIGGTETDDGVATKNDLKAYSIFNLKDSIDIAHTTRDENVQFGTVSMTIDPGFTYKFGTVDGYKVLSLKPPGRVIDDDGTDRQLPTGKISFELVSTDGNAESFTIPVTFIWSSDDGAYDCMVYDTAKVFDGITSETHAVYNISLVFSANVIIANGKNVWKATINGFNGTVSKYISKYTTIHLKQIGFDIAEYSTSAATLGYISMKTGACTGRTFPIKAVNYQNYSTSADDDRKIMDSWRLEIQRVYDKDLKQYFPNTDYPISAEDQFVLTEILLPDLYIGAAEQRLLKRANEILAELSKPIFVIEPSLDSIFVDTKEALLLFKTGVYFDFDTTVFVDDYYSRLIDTVTVSEKDAAIPIVTITLREKKRKSFKTKTSSSDSTTSTSDSISDTVNESISSGTGSSTVDAVLDTDSSNPVQNKVIVNALSKKIDKGTLATINGQSLEEGGNIVIQGGGDVTVDSALSDTSTNPVQNKVVKKAIDAKADKSSLATVATSGKYSDITGRPTNVSAFTNDAGYVKNSNIAQAVEGAQINISVFTNDEGYLTQHQSLADYAKKSDLPTKTSDLTNDSGFITSHQDLSAYAKKTDIPTKVSAFENDKGYLTQHQDLSGYATVVALNSKQDRLISGTNIKTINGKSLVGSGNITIEGGGSDSSITKLTKSEYDALAGNDALDETKLYVVTTYDASVPAGYRKINGNPTTTGNGSGIAPTDKQADVSFVLTMTESALAAYRAKGEMPIFDWLSIDYNDMVVDGWSFFGSGTEADSEAFENELKGVGVQVQYIASTGTTVVRSYYGSQEYGRLEGTANDTNAILPDEPAGVAISDYGTAYAMSQSDVIFMDGGKVIARGTEFDVSNLGGEQSARMYLGTKHIG